MYFDYDEVKEKIVIGQEGYRKIFKGELSSEFVALKVMDYAYEEDIKKEVNFLARLNHPKIVQVKGICVTESCIMMKFMPLNL